MNQTPATTRARRIRVVLLVLLVPLIVAVVWQAVHFAPRHVTGLAFSADGRELLVGRTRVGDRQQADGQNLAIEGSGFVETWDVKSSRLVCSKRMGWGKTVFAHGAKYFVDFTRAGRIHILDPKTTEPLKQWDVPRQFGAIMDVASNGHLAIVSSHTYDGTHYITCINSEGMQTLAKAAFGKALLSGDGSRLFVSRLIRPAGIWMTDVYHIDGASLTNRDEMSFTGYLLAIDESGNVLFRQDATADSILDLRTDKSRTLSPPPGWGRMTATFFTQNGDYFHALFAHGPLVTYDVKTGDIVAKSTLSPLPGFFDYHVVSGDRQTLAGVADGWRIGVWDLATGAVLAHFPNEGPGRTSFATCLLFCCVWCLAWVICGGYSQRPRPWLDAIIVNVLLIAVLTIHVATRSLPDVYGLVFDAYLALLSSLSAVFCVWGLYGVQRWSLRFAGWLAGVAAVVAALLGSGHRENPVIWFVLLASIFYVLGLVLLLGWGRWRGVIISNTVGRASMCQQSAGAGAGWQMPLVDMLVFTASVAACLGVMRFVVPFPARALLAVEVPVTGLALAATSAVAIWTALGHQRLLVRLVVLCLVAWLSGAIPTMVAAFLQSGFAVDSWFEILLGFEGYAVSLFGPTAVSVLLSFLILRLNGYVQRFGKRAET